MVFFAINFVVVISFCAFSVSEIGIKTVDFVNNFSRIWTLCVLRLCRLLSLKLGVAANGQQKNGTVNADWLVFVWVANAYIWHSDPSADAVLGNLSGFFPRDWN